MNECMNELYSVRHVYGLTNWFSLSIRTHSYVCAPLLRLRRRRNVVPDAPQPLLLPPELRVPRPEEEDLDGDEEDGEEGEPGDEPERLPLAQLPPHPQGQDGVDPVVHAVHSHHKGDRISFIFVRSLRGLSCFS